VISRVADHCFWFGRYLERTENTARVLFVTRNLALDAELPPRQCWQPVVIVSGEEADFTRRFGAEAAGDGEVVQRYMTWDPESGNCIRCTARGARENARSIREVVSVEAWEAINELHLWLGSEAARREYEQHRYGFYRHIRHVTQLCQGLLPATMLHDTPLDFIWLGVLLERVGQTARILDVHHHVITALEDRNGIVDTALWLSLLRACSGFEPFMKRHQGQVSGGAVAAFLILEPRFPRSVRYGLHRSHKILSEIRPPDEPGLPGGRALERLAGLDRWLVQKTPGSLETAQIHEVLTHVVDETTAVCREIQQELLSYGTPAAAPGGPEAETEGQEAPALPAGSPRPPVQ
jgi:uncharacterized alpha-E superfamily protein